MGWLLGLLCVALMMATSQKLWGNPLSIIGAAFVGLCVALLGGVVQAAMGF